MQSSFSVSFGEEPLSSHIVGVSGLGVGEGWGRWANDTRVLLHFDYSLPPEFDLTFACAVSSVNIGRILTVIAGGSSRRFVSNTTLHRGLESVAMRFQVKPGTRTLEFLVPDTEEAAAADGRRLGFALSSLSVAPRVSSLENYG